MPLGMVNSISIEKSFLLTESFISWIEKNYSRLHAESRSELLTLGNELLTLVRDSET